jgi:hypothetical protein
MKYKYLVFFLLLITQCKSSGEISYSNKKSFEGTSSTESKDKINNGRTYEFLFTIKNNEDCIKISIISEIFDKVQNRKMHPRTYFIVEKMVDISKFHSEENTMYSEIGRNFDSSWNVDNEIKICSIETDPIKKLKKGDKLRIRFTDFEDSAFLYNINIFSEYPVSILEKK